MSTPNLPRAILETLAYSDVFEYPLRLDEIHRYLPVPATQDALSVVLASMNGQVGKMDGFYFIKGNQEIVKTRKQRDARSKRLLPHALRYGQMLGSVPFVRMVALTGSLAVMNVSKNPDFDYMLVTSPGKVWTARAFALLLNRFAGLFGHTLCPNLIVSETALEWPLHDLYSARELAQMIPITRMDVYQRLMKANEWAGEFLPNAFPPLRGRQNLTRQSPFPFWRLLRRSFRSLLAMIESLLRGKLGSRLENWEMNRKIARFSKQEGFGEETVFTADVCQGNFHHHRKWTQEVFEERLAVIARRAKPEEAISSIVTEIASLPSVAHNDEIIR